MWSRSRRRSAVAGLGLVAVTFGVRAFFSRRTLVDRIAPDLRIPLLWAPLQLTTTAPVLRLMSHLDLPEPAPPTDVSVDHVMVPGLVGGPDVPAWVYRPLDMTDDPAALAGGLVWIHGGGYLLGSAGMDHEVCARFVRSSGAVVVNPDYRLAPSAPFPAAIDDCWAGLRWLVDHAADLGVEPDRIAVAGESAGGGLAAALAQRAYDAGLALRLQALVYPMLDDRTVADTDRPETLVWTNVSNQRGWSAYLGHPIGQPEDRPYAVPARRADLAGLAPAWIVVGDQDLFHDEDAAYAQRLQAASVDCTLEVVEGMYHGALGLAPASSPTGQALRTSLVQAVRVALLPRLDGPAQKCET